MEYFINNLSIKSSYQEKGLLVITQISHNKNLSKLYFPLLIETRNTPVLFQIINLNILVLDDS